MRRLWRSQVILILAGIVLQIQTSEYCHGAECQRTQEDFKQHGLTRRFVSTTNEETYNFNVISRVTNGNSNQSKMKKKRDSSSDSGVNSETAAEEELFVDFEDPTENAQPERSSPQPESSSPQPKTSSPQPEKKKDQSSGYISEFVSILKNMKFVFSLPLKIIFVNSPEEKVPPKKSTQHQKHAVDSCEIYT